MSGFFSFGGTPSASNASQNKSQNQNSGNEQNNSSQQQNNSPSNTENNNENNMDSPLKIWENKNSGTDNSQNQQQNQQQQQNASQSLDAETVFKQHVESLNLTNGIDIQKLQADLQEGNSESLNEAFAQVAENTYRASMTQMNKLVQKQVEAAVKIAVQESGSAMNTNLAVREMNQVLPFTTDEDVRPVAEAALKNMMNNGMGVSEAIETVSKFFARTANMVSSNTNADSGSPGSGNFNRNRATNNQNNNAKNEDDWMKLLAQ